MLFGTHQARTLCGPERTSDRRLAAKHICDVPATITTAVGHPRAIVLEQFSTLLAPQRYPMREAYRKPLSVLAVADNRESREAEESQLLAIVRSSPPMNRPR